ncbi:MAG: ATP-dependent helicase C-terminal domain-containing protein, partial [Myxococcota bacterium]
KVPSGSVKRLHYSAEGPPALSVRLQEVFGLYESPRLADGRVAVKMELLAPNQRPVQVTQDLGSFWSNTYAEVRKELRQRYPKHQWPEDPRDGIASARVLRRRKGQP